MKPTFEVLVEWLDDSVSRFDELTKKPEVSNGIVVITEPTTERFGERESTVHYVSIAATHFVTISTSTPVEPSISPLDDCKQFQNNLDDLKRKEMILDRRLQGVDNVIDDPATAGLLDEINNLRELLSMTRLIETDEGVVPELECD